MREKRTNKKNLPQSRRKSGGRKPRGRPRVEKGKELQFFGRKVTLPRGTVGRGGGLVW